MARDRTDEVEVAPKEAVMVATCEAVNADALAVKEVEEAPAGMVTEPGTVSAAALSKRVTAMPPVGATAERFTVQEALPPGAKEAGEQFSEVRVSGAVSERLADLEEPFREAVTEPDWDAESAPAVAVKEADSALAGTVTVDGMVSAARVSVSETSVPAAGAAFESVMAHEVLEFCVRVAGAQVSAVICAGTASVTDAVAEDPLREAVMVAA